MFYCNFHCSSLMSRWLLCLQISWRRPGLCCCIFGAWQVIKEKEKFLIQDQISYDALPWKVAKIILIFFPLKFCPHMFVPWIFLLPVLKYLNNLMTIHRCVWMYFKQYFILKSRNYAFRKIKETQVIILL